MWLYSQKTFSPIKIALFGIIFSIFFIAALIYHSPDFRAAFETNKNRPTQVVTDRNGKILRIVPDKDGHVNIWKGIEELPVNLIQATIYSEDRRFYYHPGFDPLAIIRAAFTNMKRLRKVSGASTISQQVVRLINPRPRTYYSKLIELLESLKLEFQLSKTEILELYLNMVPMGGQLRGMGLASLIYFSKDVSLVGFHEAACLAVIPRAPTRFDPTNANGRGELLKNADLLLRKMISMRANPNEQVDRSYSQKPLRFHPRILPNEAPHFVNEIVKKYSNGEAEIKTTIDWRLQSLIEQKLQSHKERLRHLGAKQSAVIVVSTENRDVLSMVGSLNYGHDNLGYNNGATSFRSAGSTLKPFLYALALSKGFSGSSEVADTFRIYKTGNGDYMPFNANRISYGPVTFRSALGNSLNIPAIKMMEHVRLGEFYSLLKDLGLISEKHDHAEKYGLGLTLGAIEIRLFDLVQAYACLSDQGNFLPLRVVLNERNSSKKIFPEQVASEINDILKDPLARILALGNPVYFDFGFPVSLKTGTSSKFRDSWAIGYTSRHVVGVWAGNFEGFPTRDAYGAISCGPILKEIMSLIYLGTEVTMPDQFSKKKFTTSPDDKPLEICEQQGNIESQLASGKEHIYLGPAYARWIHKREKEQGPGRFRLQPTLDPEKKRYLKADTKKRKGVEIVNPHDGDRFVFLNSHPPTIVIRAQPREVVKEIIWLIDGKEASRTPPPYEFFWKSSMGEHTIHAVTPSNEATQIRIKVDSR